jgi:hypothetical protein
MAAAGDMTGIQGNTVRGLPREAVRAFLGEHGLLGR